MALNLYRAQWSIPRDTGLPEDVFVNTWHFQGDDPVQSRADDAADIAVVLAAFYAAIDGLVFPNTVGPSATCKVYAMNDPEPRAPIVTSTHALTPSTAPSLPHEVAVCLSFSAAIASGGVRARRRGRVFLGPMHLDTIIQTGGRVQVTEALRTGVATAASGLKASAAAADVPWVVYSPTNDPTGEAVPAAISLVDNGWIDNAFDTQRRRGDDPTARTTWT